MARRDAGAGGRRRGQRPDEIRRHRHGLAAEVEPDIARHPRLFRFFEHACTFLSGSARFYAGLVAEDLDLLVADADRAKAAEELRVHLDAGRLTLEEFEGRLAEANGARTRGDLEHAMRQLPRSEPPASLRIRDRRWSSLALQYVLVNLVCILVWLFSGNGIHDFWPKWVLVGTLVMYLRRLGRRSRRPPLPPADEGRG